MADTFTAHYNLTKPQIGGDPDTWGTLLNANFDAIDSQLYTASTYAVPLAGGTMSGNLNITKTTSQVILALSASAGQYRTLLFNTGANARWGISADVGAESGSNAGSNFLLSCYTDAGANLSNPLTIARATGVATFSARPVFGAATPWDSANFTPGNYALLSGAAFTGNVSLGAGSTLVATQPGTSPAGSNITIGSPQGIPGITAQYSTAKRRDIRFGSGSVDVGASSSTAAPTNFMSVLESGVVTSADFQASSDARLKTDIRKLRRGLDELKRMLPVEYVKGSREEIGFIAQEAREVIPEAVSVDPEGFLTLSYGQVVALVASAVLDLDARMALAGI